MRTLPKGFNKSKLVDSECVYILCPDPKCRLFTNPNSFTSIPCRFKCPKKAMIAVVCWSCSKQIVLPNDFSSFCRIDCKCGAMNMQHMRNKYRRLNKSKTIDNENKTI